MTEGKMKTRNIFVVRLRNGLRLAADAVESLGEIVELHSSLYGERVVTIHRIPASLVKSIRIVSVEYQCRCEQS